MATKTTDALTERLQDIRTLIAHNLLKRAAQDLNHVQKEHPGDARVPLLGMRLAEQGNNIAGAEECARRALRLAPGWHVAQIELARVLTRQQKNTEAMQLALQALAAEPNNAEVMSGAINVAMYSGNQEQTLKWATEGVRRFPDSGIRLFLARYLVSLGRHAEAVPHYAYIHERLPKHEEALRGLLSCARALSDDGAAQKWADALLALHPDDDDARYWHAVAHGATPPTQPASVVRGIFDRYAESYDVHLTRTLKSQVPKHVAELVRSARPDLRFNLLDLGCGTGLVGLYLGRIQGHFIGADLSEPMLRQAARHKLYARLHHVNLLDALRETPANEFEVITCADALIYVGDLAPVLPAALRILKAGGVFVFSCEEADEDGPDLVLRRSQRYAHKATAVEAACRAAGFDSISVEHVAQLRLDQGQPVAGFYVTARKASAAPADADV